MHVHLCGCACLVTLWVASNFAAQPGGDGDVHNDFCWRGCGGGSGGDGGRDGGGGRSDSILMISNE